MKTAKEDFFLKKRKEEKTITFLTKEELVQFFEAIKKSDKKYRLRDLTLFKVMYLGGLRASEVQLLKLENYKPTTKELFIKRLKGSNNTTIRITKTEYIRLINNYIKEYSGDDLNKINNNSDYLFKGQNWKPLDLEAIRFLFKEYSKLAGLPKEKQHPHILKHTIAVHLAENGADIKDLQYYLGHKNINNTIIYFQYTTKQLDHFYNKINFNNLV